MHKLHVMYASTLVQSWAAPKGTENYEWEHIEVASTASCENHPSSQNSRLAMEPCIPQFLGWVHATQLGRITTKCTTQATAELGEHNTHTARLAMKVKLHELNYSSVAAEGSDTQTPAVPILHSTYKCRSLSLFISSIQHLPLLGLFLRQIHIKSVQFKCTHVQMHREIYWTVTV